MRRTWVTNIYFPLDFQSHQDRFKFAILFRGNFGFFECLLKINFDYLKYGSCAELYFI